ncbi:MAG: S24 family peptidase [Planctomycetota bacterium]
MFFTDKQLRILNFIRDSVRAKGHPPTLDEMARHFRVSKVTIHGHVCALESKNALRRVPRVPRSIEVLETHRGATNSAPCSHPVEGTLDPRSFHVVIQPEPPLDITPPPGTFVLRVSQPFPALPEAHTPPQDYVFLQRDRHARDGDLVLARVHGRERMLARVSRDRGGALLLQPLRPGAPSIRPRTWRIDGVVVAILRRLE